MTGNVIVNANAEIAAISNKGMISTPDWGYDHTNDGALDVHGASPSMSEAVDVFGGATMCREKEVEIVQSVCSKGLV